MLTLTRTITLIKMDSSFLISKLSFLLYFVYLFIFIVKKILK